MVYRVLDQRSLFWHTKEKFRNTKRRWVFLSFLEVVKITSVGLKLDRPQLQYWLLFLEHNRLWSKDLLLQAYLYLWTMTVSTTKFEPLAVLLISSNAGSSSSSCIIWMMQAPALVNLRRHTFIMFKFFRTVPHALAYKQLTQTSSSTYNVLLSTEILTTRTDQSKRDILIHYALLEQEMQLSALSSNDFKNAWNNLECSTKHWACLTVVIKFRQ